MKRILLGCLVLLLTAGGTSPMQAQSGNDLFQQALRKERVDGDLKSAIALYQRILKEQAADRPLCAKTLVQLGEAFEKMGNADARSSYQRVIREYADQAEQVTVARARLGALAGARTGVGSEPIARRIWSGPDADEFGGPTRDGRFLTYVDWTFGDLAVRDLATGEKRLLTKKGSWVDVSYALFSTPSPDGRRVAYAWMVDTRQKNGLPGSELRLIGIDGGAPSVLYSNPDVVYLHPSDWSLDGRQIATWLSRKDQESQIALIDASNGGIRILKTVDWRGPGKMSFSPDGKYLAFDLPVTRESSAPRDIFVLATDGSAENVLVRHAAHDVVMGWAPNGKHVLFASDRTGNMSVWLVPVANGKAAGEPVLVRRDVDFASVTPMGFTQNGSFLYATHPSPTDMYVAAIEPSSGRSTGAPTRLVDHLVGANRAADWTRDGTAAVYVSEPQRGLAVASSSLIVRSLVTGAERVVPKQLNALTSPRWSPDGRYIAGNGRDQTGRPGIFRVDANSGEATMLVDGAGRSFAGWLPDGKSIVYLIQDLSQGVLGIVRQRLDSGESKDLVRMPFKRNTNLYSIDVSPNGQQVAFAIISDSAAPTRLRVISTEGGESRELFRSPEGAQIGSLAWSADGQNVFFVLSNEKNARVMRVAATGGPAQETGVVMEGTIRYLRAHPDGRHLGFSAGTQVREVWIMENFLPKTGTPGKATQR